MIIVPFLKRNGESEQEFEDYAAYIELRKLISSAHNEVRNEAKRLLLINPDDTSNWRNALRRCQHCGEVWVRVEGCDGETTCGLVPTTGDPYGDESYFKYMWTKVGEAWRPEKVGRRKNARFVRCHSEAGRLWETNRLEGPGDCAHCRSRCHIQHTRARANFEQLQFEQYRFHRQETEEGEECSGIRET